jgi:mono/diheme cytochrome c family protein
MDRLKKISLVCSVLLLLLIGNQCKHEPFPAPPLNTNNTPIDTVENPIDSNSAKPCHPDTIYYSRDVQPILNANCAYSGCHGQGSSQDGVNLSDYNSVLTTADVRAGDLDGSDLFEVISETDPDKVMPPPPNTRLTASEIATIRKWILQGAQNLRCNDCDTLNLTYNGKIKMIFTQNCVSCHGSNNPNAGLSLTTYNQVKDALLNTSLLARVKGNSALPVMPPNGPMNSCNVRSIEKWFNEGMIE